jgi:hypothetical protein
MDTQERKKRIANVKRNAEHGKAEQKTQRMERMVSRI